MSLTKGKPFFFFFFLALSKKKNALSHHVDLISKNHQIKKNNN